MVREPVSRDVVEQLRDGGEERAGGGGGERCLRISLVGVSMGLRVEHLDTGRQGAEAQTGQDRFELSLHRRVYITALQSVEPRR